MRRGFELAAEEVDHFAGGPGSSCRRGGLLRDLCHRGALDRRLGSEGLGLLRPKAGRCQCLVVTRCSDEGTSEALGYALAFTHGHPGSGPVGSSGPSGSRPLRAVGSRDGGWGSRLGRSRRPACGY